MSRPPTTAPSQYQNQLDTDDALNPKFNTSTLDFLLLELVPLAQRVSERLLEREEGLVEEFGRSKIVAPPQGQIQGLGQNTGQDGERREETTETGEAGQKGGEGEHGAVVEGSEAAGAGTQQTEIARREGKGEVEMTSLGFPSVNSQTREGMRWRLDRMGYRVGQGLIERYVRASNTLPAADAHPHPIHHASPPIVQGTTSRHLPPSFQPHAIGTTISQPS